MKNYIAVLLLAGCGCGHSLPPETYDVVITEAKHSDSSEPPVDAGVDAEVPPIHTWMMPSDINKLQRENLDKMLDESMRCTCAKGDPICPCIVK